MRVSTPCSSCVVLTLTLPLTPTLTPSPILTLLEARDAVRVERLVQERQLARRAVGRAHQEDVQETRLELGQG